MIENFIPKVSVIIPVYNVELYIRKCIESIINQTLKDIEIILVDDGSTDDSGRICEEYKKHDDRIKVIHKTNGGLSSARNAGIDIALAPYFMFLDSDDYVEPGFCEIPYNAAVDTGSDIVIFQTCYVKDGKKLKGYNGELGVIDFETAIKNGESVAWNKLYKSELFANIRYPEGRVYEDIAVTHKIIFTAKKILMLPDFLYNFIYRDDSISHIRSVYNKRDGFLSALDFAKDMKSFGCSIDYYEMTLVSYAIGLLAIGGPSDDAVYEKAEEVLDAVKCIPAGLTKEKKLMLMIWKIDKRLFHFICSVTGHKETCEI